MTPYGTTKDGRAVHAIMLKGHGLTATVLTYGAILQALFLDGTAHSLTVGSDDLSDYEGAMLYHGAIVGPVANRISGGSTVIDGISHQFERNDGGKHLLHGGKHGTHARIWDVIAQDESALTLSLDLPDGDGGLPANRRITARYELTGGPTLRLTLTTTTDAPSIANLANHSYWNLDGTGHMDDQKLQIHADSYLPADDETIPTGDIAPVDGTPFDFRQTRPIALGATPFDHNLCLAATRREMTDVLTLSGKDLTMTLATTEPGLHLYDDRPAYAALAIEAQNWPNGANTPQFPTVAIGPDAPLVQQTEWRFTRS